MISAFLVRMALAMLLSPAAVLVQAQACSAYTLSACDTCLEGPVPGRYRGGPSGKPCKCGDEAAYAGQVCENGKAKYPDCCTKDWSKETASKCYCGDKSDGSMQECSRGTVCDANAEGGPQCHYWPRCSIVDGSAPLPKGEGRCTCGSALAYGGYTCLASENKVTSDTTKCSEGTTLADNCICSADSPPYTMVQISSSVACYKGQKCDVDADTPQGVCTWPVCAEGEGPSKEERCTCKNGDDETTCDYGEVCKSGFCQCEPSSEVACRYTTLEADETCPLSNCKHDPKSSASILSLAVCQSGPGGYNRIQHLSKTDDGYSIIVSLHQKKDASDESCEGTLISKEETFYTSGGCRIPSGPAGVAPDSKITFVYDKANDPKLSDGGTHNMHVFWSVFVPSLVLLLL